jgi:hypothetical protein
VFEGLGYSRGFEPETWSVLDADLGYRMRHPRFVPPAPDRVDLVLIGDSITFAMGKPPPGTVNLSGVGFGTDQELILLERHLADLKRVDRVVLNFSLSNDFIDNVSVVNPHDGFRAKSYFTLEGDELTLHREHLRASAWDRMLLWISQRSGAVFYVRMLLAPQRAPSASDPFRFQGFVGSPSNELRRRYESLLDASLPLTRRLLLRMAHTVEERLQARFAVLVFPSNYWPAANPLQMPVTLRAFFAGFDFAVEDLGCHAARSGLAYRDVAYDPFGHLTQRGNRLAAEVIGALPGDPAAASPCRIAPSPPSLRIDGPAHSSGTPKRS